MSLKDPRVIIAAGTICFAFALLDLMTRCPTQIYNWHRCLSAFGWAATIGAALSLVWLIVSTVIRFK